MIKDALKLKNWIWTLAIIVLVGCSTDSISGDETGANRSLEVTVIGIDAESVYQLSYDASLESQNVTNLTAQLGVQPDFLTLRQFGDLISFYSFSGGRFSIYLKEIETGNTRIFEDFYTNTPQRAVTWGINDATNVYFGYFGPFGSPNLGIQDLILEGSEEIDTVVDFNVDATFGPLLYDGKVYIAYLDNLGEYKLKYYDTVTKTAGPLLSLGSTAFSFFITGAGDLAVVKIETNPTLDLYRADDLVFIESVPLSVAPGFSVGVVEDALLLGNELYFNYVYPQPARFAEGPAIYNLDTNEFTLVDIGGLVNVVEAEIGTSLFITTQIYDPAQGVFLIGYGTAENEIEGGVMVASKDGDLLARVSTPFFPTYFVRN